MLTAMISTVVVSAMWVIGIAVFYYTISGKDPAFAVKMVVPPQANVGDSIKVEMEVTNPSDSLLELDSIDIEETLSKGFELQRIEPAPEQTILDEGDPALIWTNSLAPGESFSALIGLKAVNAGIWTGDLSFWDENSQGYVSSLVTLRVKPESATMRGVFGSQPAKEAVEPD